MAVTNWVNYAGIPAQKPDFGLSDLVDNAYKGYEYSKLPAKLREEQEKRVRENALQRIREQFLPQEKQVSLDTGRENLAALRRKSAEDQALTDALNQQNGQSSYAQPAPTGQTSQAPGNKPSVSSTGTASSSDFEGPWTGNTKYGYVASPQDLAQASNTTINPVSPANAANAIKTALTNPPPETEIAGETIISPGNPNHYNIDQLYENNPSMRKGLEAKGLSKKVATSYDKESGDTMVTTTFPSGKVTVRRSGGGAVDGKSKLTNPSKTKHQDVVAGVDNVLPIIDDLMAMDLERWAGINNPTYNAKVIEGLESLAAGMNYPKGEHSLKMAKKQIEKSPMESMADYKARMKILKKDLRSRKARSQKTLTSGIELSEVEEVKTPGGKTEEGEVVSGPGGTEEGEVVSGPGGTEEGEEIDVPSFSEDAKKFIPASGRGAGQGLVNSLGSMGNFPADVYEGLGGSHLPHIPKVDFTKADREAGGPAASGAKVGDFVGGLVAPGGAAFKGTKAAIKAAPLLRHLPKALQTVMAGATTGAALSEDNRLLGAGIGAALPAIPGGAKWASNLGNSQKGPAKFIQKQFSSLEKKASNIYDDISGEIKSRGVSKMKPDQDYLDLAKDVLPKTRAYKKLIKGAADGDYDATRKLNTQMYEKGTREIGNDNPAISNQGAEILEARQDSVEALSEHLIDTGHKDLSADLDKANEMWRHMKDVFTEDRQLANMVSGNRKIPKDALAKFTEDSDSMRKLHKEYPEIKDLVSKAGRDEKVKKLFMGMLKGAGYTVPGGATGAALWKMFT